MLAIRLEASMNDITRELQKEVNYMILQKMDVP